MTRISHHERDEPSPFHPGEQAIQARLGVREAIEPWARQVIRAYLTPEHQAFYAALPFVVAAARDPSGRPWASLLTGAPGFMRATAPDELAIAARPAAGDALCDSLVPGCDVGLLGIEFGTRRRNRVNGQLLAGRDGLALQVSQAFGNCPQHISARDWEQAPMPVERPQPVRASSLDAISRALITRADTCFLATGHRGEDASPANGMDASHRGGPVGFVEVLDARRLRFPDYSGNNHFNTLGNLVLDPRIGLLFVDFDRGDLVQVSGRAAIDFAPGEDQGEARRWIDVEIDAVNRVPGAIPLRFRAASNNSLSLRLAERVVESEDVTSFVFESASTAALPAFRAGQHLPIRVTPNGQEHGLRRTYSLSHAPGYSTPGDTTPGDTTPGPSRYRISVKREPKGQASAWLHDHLAPGMVIAAETATGDFVLESQIEGPLLFVAGGIGITPLASMLHELGARDAAPPVSLVHVVRDGAHQPLVAELRRLFSHHPDWRLHATFTRPAETDVAGVDYRSSGRLDAAVLRPLLPTQPERAYLCGPASFMAATRDLLVQLGVPKTAVRTESF